MFLLQVNGAGDANDVAVRSQDGHVRGAFVVWGGEVGSVVAGVVGGEVVFDSGKRVQSPIFRSQICHQLP